MFFSLGEISVQFTLWPKRQKRYSYDNQIFIIFLAILVYIMSFFSDSTVGNCLLANSTFVMISSLGTLVGATVKVTSFLSSSSRCRLCRVQGCNALNHIFIKLCNEFVLWLICFQITYLDRKRRSK